MCTAHIRRICAASRWGYVPMYNCSAYGPLATFILALCVCYWQGNVTLWSGLLLLLLLLLSLRCPLSFFSTAGNSVTTQSKSLGCCVCRSTNSATAFHPSQHPHTHTTNLIIFSCPFGIAAPEVSTPFQVYNNDLLFPLIKSSLVYTRGPPRSRGRHRNSPLSANKVSTFFHLPTRGLCSISLLCSPWQALARNAVLQERVNMALLLLARRKVDFSSLLQRRRRNFPQLCFARGGLLWQVY